MPDPKDHMDDDHEYVGGYVRRKHGDSPKGRRFKSWFRNIAWYWRLLIAFGIPIGVVALVAKYPFILLGLVIPFIFWFVASSTKRKRKQGKPLDKNGKIGL